MASGPAWTGVEYLAPTKIRSLDFPGNSESLYCLRYPSHFSTYILIFSQYSFFSTRILSVLGITFFLRHHTAANSNTLHTQIYI